MAIKERIKNDPLSIPIQRSPFVTSKLDMANLRIGVLIQLFRLINTYTRNPLKSIRFIAKIKKKYQSIFGESFLSKAAKVDGRYFWRLASPGFPSKGSWEMQRHEVSRFFPNSHSTGLRSLIFAITKKCPLNCEHCFEWENLGKDEALDCDEIIKIIHKYQQYGTTQIMLSGGEPMVRVNDIYKILEAAHDGTDFWIITSGLGLSEERAHKLKASGLTGVMVSMDHYAHDKHNAFRGSANVYTSATEAVLNANKAGLVTSLSLCATKPFVTQENMTKYMDFAKELGVSFVQILEPRAAGRYSGMDVALDEQHLNLLKSIYLEYNSSEVFADYPIINYLGFHQRKVGCFGAGDRFFYIDTDGDAHVCPFCVQKVANTNAKEPEEIIELLSNVACHDFEKNHVL